MPDSLAALSPGRLQAAKDFGLAECFSAVSMSLYESLQLSGRHGQDDCPVGEALVCQIEVVLIDQLSEPIVIHQSDRNRVLFDR
jgi:hypothetical protein